MEKLKEYPATENELPVQFLSDDALTKLEMANANPFIKMNVADISMPFIVMADGGIIVDNTANNPKNILKNFQLTVSATSFYGAGFIDIYYGNKTIALRHVESTIFKKKWRIDDVVSALQLELNIYYPGYHIQSR